MTDATHSSAEHHGVGHVVPLRVLFSVLAGLLLLTFLGSYRALSLISIFHLLAPHIT